MVLMSTPARRSAVAVLCLRVWGLMRFSRSEGTVDAAFSTVRHNSVVAGRSFERPLESATVWISGER